MSKKNNKNIWIVSDIDGTFMDHQYDFTPALPTIELLKKNQIPLIFCTSKTAAEVKKLRNEIGINDPYIVENGAAIYGINNDNLEEWELILGSSYKQLRSLLDKISIEIGYQLRALNDLNRDEIKQLTGLHDKDIDLALDRHWSVPFLTPPSPYLEKLSDLQTKLNVNIYQGNRMSHLLDKRSHKGKAVNRLKEFFGGPTVYIIALGDSHNDLPLLQVADQAVVIPGFDGPNKSLEIGLRNGHFLLASEPHSKGWSNSVNKLIKEYI